MDKDEKENHNCDNVNCNHNNTKGLCCMFNPDNCKYRQLQKENAELKKACDETQELLDKQIEATLKLDKENAELKEYNKYLRRKRQGGIQKQYNKVAIIKQQADQLAKAKELLKQWVELYKPKLEGYPITPIQEQTEQFLNSEVEK